MKVELMKKILCAVLIVLWVSVACAQTPSAEKPVLVRKIIVAGLVPQNKAKLEQIIKPYRNKRLSTQDIDRLVQSIKEYYLEAGYDGLVDMDYTVRRNQLLIHVALARS